MAKRCYILGAGFSKACGLPLARELMELVWRRRQKQSQEFDPIGLLDQQRDFLRHFFPSCDLEKKWPHFEELLTLLDEWDDFAGACGSSEDQFIQSFKKTLDGWHHLLCHKVD